MPNEHLAVKGYQQGYWRWLIGGGPSNFTVWTLIPQTDFAKAHLLAAVNDHEATRRAFQLGTTQVIGVVGSHDYAHYLGNYGDGEDEDIVNYEAAKRNMVLSLLKFAIDSSLEAPESWREARTLLGPHTDERLLHQLGLPHEERQRSVQQLIEWLASLDPVVFLEAKLIR